MKLLKSIFSNYSNAIFILCVGFVLIFSFKFFLIHDFGNYYFGAYFLKCGEFDSGMYFPHIFNQRITELGYSNIYQTYSPHTPFLALCFYPFTFLSVYYTKIFFNIISVVLFTYSANKLFKSFKINNKYAFLILLIFVIPFYKNILFGQLYFLIFFLVAEGYFSYINNKLLKTGMLWAFAIALKIFPIFLLFFLIFNRKWKQLGYVVGCVFLLILISLIWIDVEIWSFYITDVFTKALNGEMYAEFVPHYQSVDELLKHYLVFHPNFNPNPLFDNYSMYKGLLVGFKSLLIMVGALFAIQKKEFLFQFSYWVFAAILFSSYGSSYSMILLLFIVIFLLKDNKVLTPRLIFYLGTIFLICNLPVSIFVNFKFPFLKTLMYLIILIGLFINTIPFDKLKLVIGFSLFVSIVISVKQKPQVREKYFTFKTQPGLIYDYEVEKSNIVAKYWSVEGEKEYVFEPEIANYSTNYVALIDNQIYLNNEQITFSNSNKLKPILINRNSIVYLSDQGRGIGFYTLREIEIP